MSDSVVPGVLGGGVVPGVEVLHCGGPLVEPAIQALAPEKLVNLLKVACPFVPRVKGSPKLLNQARELHQALVCLCIPR